MVEVNTAVTDNLEHLADDPYGDGWLVKIRVDATQLWPAFEAAEAAMDKISDRRIPR